MKQFQFDYHSITSLKRDLDKISLWCRTKIVSHVVFQIYSDSLDKGQIDLVCDVVGQCFPDAVCMGCSTNGNIIEGRLSCVPISIVCTIFEYPTTQIKLLQYTLNSETALDVVASIKEEIKANPWVKAAELQMTIRGMSMTPFCEAFTDVDPSIMIFGGGAFSSNLFRNDACVFSNVKGYSEQGLLVLLMGGEDFYCSTTHITGWKPLGREFLVSKADRNILYELDGIPAYDAYYRYLNIENDENFFLNTLEFPFFYKHNGINILRAPIACRNDGALVMTSDIDENVKARLAYGDPQTILACIRDDGRKIGEFNPEIIKVFSCAARRTFWGKSEISNETLPLQSLAPTSGFYTSGEFLRTGKFVNQHNVTLVIASMREGEGGDRYDFEMAQTSFSGNVSMINRLATFINAATQELVEVNEKLSLISMMDSLTNLFNRGEIQRRIKQAVEQKKSGSLVMFDIDEFKKINDTFGHHEGDAVIKGFSLALRSVADQGGYSGIEGFEFDLTRYLEGKDSFATRTIDVENIQSPTGRWGGEEFMTLLIGLSAEEAREFAEKVRKSFNEMVFEKAKHCSVSIGVTAINENDDTDAVYVRVDQALYKAKAAGRNCVVVL